MDSFENNHTNNFDVSMRVDSLYNINYNGIEQNDDDVSIHDVSIHDDDDEHQDDDDVSIHNDDDVSIHDDDVSIHNDDDVSIHDDDVSIHNDDDQDNDDQDNDDEHQDDDQDDDQDNDQDDDDVSIHDDQDDYLLCPICKDLLIVPRLYNCGHNVCEECMLLTDKVLDENSPYTIPIYKCPICRAETMQKWYDRPINNTLIDILSRISSEYKIRNKHHKRRKISDIPEKTIPKNINLAYISHNIREFKSESIYNQIVPILYRAALDGK